MRRLPAEFEEQSFVQLIFPHAQSDWAPYLEKASRTFVAIASAIARYEPCLIICDDVARVRTYFSDFTNLLFVHYQSDDTWARDCSGITVYDDKDIEIIDFTFNGWGGKFDASLDNAMTSALTPYYENPVRHSDLVLEGGAIESNGEGVLLSTSACLLNPNRNTHLSQEKIEKELKHTLGVQEILWLHHGYLSGDDTDSHIDTLARFITPESIMYVQCLDHDDEHYDELTKMEHELMALRRSDNTPYTLIALPMCDAIYFEQERLPATYANFLMIDDAVLVPIYGVAQDDEAIRLFRKSFRDHDVIAIDCSILIRQHGSLHCVTMQFPKDTVININ